MGVEELISIAYQTPIFKYEITSFSSYSHPNSNPIPTIVPNGPLYLCIQTDGSLNHVHSILYYPPTPILIVHTNQ